MITHFNVRPTTEQELQDGMPYITSSMIEAVNTCPKNGIIRNIMGKSFTSGYRQMALEAGSLMHEIFCAFNLAQIRGTQGLVDHAFYHGGVNFTHDRWEAINHGTDWTTFQDNPIPVLEKLVYGVIGTSEFYDDPNDNRRTTSNLELCGLMLAPYFASNHLAFDIHITDRADPTAPVGIEMSLDVVFEITIAGQDEPVLLRFIGLADAVYQNQQTKKITLGEYKTGAVLDNAWREAFETRHQITGYQAALSAYFGDLLSYNTMLTGTTIPVPRTKQPNMHFIVQRDPEHFVDFLTTAMFTQEVITRYNTEEAVVYAPMFTHSCNRFRRSCALLDLCVSSHNDQLAMVQNMATKVTLSPSEEKALMKTEVQ